MRVDIEVQMLMLYKMVKLSLFDGHFPKLVLGATKLNLIALRCAVHVATEKLASYRLDKSD